MQSFVSNNPKKVILFNSTLTVRRCDGEWYHLFLIFAVFDVSLIACRRQQVYKLMFCILSRITLVEVTINRWRDATLICGLSVNWNTYLNNESPPVYSTGDSESTRGWTGKEAKKP